MRPIWPRGPWRWPTCRRVRARVRPARAWIRPARCGVSRGGRRGAVRQTTAREAAARVRATTIEPAILCGWNWTKGNDRGQKERAESVIWQRARNEGNREQLAKRSSAGRWWGEVLPTYLEFRHDLCARPAVDERDVPQSWEGVLVERIEDLCVVRHVTAELGPLGGRKNAMRQTRSERVLERTCSRLRTWAGVAC